MCSGSVRFWSYLRESGVTENPHQRQWLFLFSLAFNRYSFCTSVRCPGISDKCPLVHSTRSDFWVMHSSRSQCRRTWLQGAARGQWKTEQAWGLLGMASTKRTCFFPLLAFSCLNVRCSGFSLGTPEHVLDTSIYGSWYQFTCDTCVNAVVSELCATQEEFQLPTQRCPKPPKMPWLVLTGLWLLLQEIIGTL